MRNEAKTRAIICPRFYCQEAAAPTFETRPPEAGAAVLYTHLQEGSPMELQQPPGEGPRELRMREQTLGGRLSDPEAPGDPQQCERSATGLLRESPPNANPCSGCGFAVHLLENLSVSLAERQISLSLVFRRSLSPCFCRWRRQASERM